MVIGGAQDWQLEFSKGGTIQYWGDGAQGLLQAKQELKYVEATQHPCPSASPCLSFPGLAHLPCSPHPPDSLGFSTMVTEVILYH